VSASWAYDSTNYGRGLTTPDVYCADPFDDRPVWSLHDVEAVYRAGRWRADDESWVMEEVALALMELVQLSWPSTRTEDAFVVVHPGRRPHGRAFAGLLIPSRSRLVAALRPDMSEREVQLWLAFGRTAERPLSRAQRWWMDVPQDWRSSIDGGIRTLIDGDTYLPGLAPTLSLLGPGTWLAQLVDDVAVGTLRSEGGEPHVMGLGPIEQVRRLMRLTAQMGGAMNDLLAAMDAWRTRLLADDRHVDAPQPWPSGGSREWMQWVMPVQAAINVRGGWHPSEAEATSLATRLMAAYAGACDVSDLMDRQAERACRPDRDEYVRLVAACDGFLAAADFALAWRQRPQQP
jgi:hypothetical protein